MIFGRVGSDGICIDGARGDIAPSLVEGLQTPIQVVFAFPFLEYKPSHTILLVSCRLDPVQPIGGITISGLGGDVAS